MGENLDSGVKWRHVVICIPAGMTLTMAQRNTIPCLVGFIQIIVGETVFAERLCQIGAIDVQSAHLRVPPSSPASKAGSHALMTPRELADELCKWGKTIPGCWLGLRLLNAGPWK